MFTALITASVGVACLSLGVLIGLVTAYRFLDAFMHLLGIYENPDVDLDVDELDDTEAAATAEAAV